jgi:hypothetical protein
MSVLKHILEVIDLLDDPRVNGETVRKFFTSKGFSDLQIEVETIYGDKGSTDFVAIKIPGKSSKRSESSFPTLGVIGRLGGIGARPTYL